MQQDSEVVAIYAKVTADGIFVTLFQKNFPQKPAIPFRHVVENLLNLFPHLLGGNGTEDVYIGGGNLRLLFVVEGIGPGSAAIVLEQDIVAHGINEGPEAFGLADLALPQGGKNTGESLLPNVFNGLRRVQARAQLQLDQFTEIRNEMLLGSEISGVKTLDIRLVKRLELQESPLADDEWQ